MTDREPTSRTHLPTGDTCAEHSGLVESMHAIKEGVDLCRGDVRELRNLVIGLLVSVVLASGALSLASCGLFSGGMLSTTVDGKTVTVSAKEDDAGCVELGAEYVDENSNTIGASCVVASESK